MLRFAIVSLLPKDLNDLINSVREYFEPGVSLKIPPHTTLHFPFWLRGSEEEMYDRLKNISKNLKAFKAQTGEIGAFGKVLYLQVLPREQFANIYEQLTTCLKDIATIDTGFFPDKQIPEYVSHITLALKAGYITSEVKQLRNLGFLVDRLVVLSNKEKEGMWKIERMFKFGP